MSDDPRKPTDAELALLAILWDRGPSTVRQVHSALDSSAGYTTVLKTFQIMNDKGFVARDTSQRSHVYTPTWSQSQVQGRLVNDLVDKAFGGNTGRLVLRALEASPADPSEIAEIRALLDALEEKPGEEGQ